MPKTNIKFEDLNSLSGLQRLDKSFLRYLSIYAPDLEEKITYYREIGSTKLKESEYSKFIIETGAHLDDFIADLFSINAENLEQKKQYENFDAIYEARRKFVQRYALKKYSKDQTEKLDFAKITEKLTEIMGIITQSKLANAINNWQLNSDDHQHELELSAQYCALMYYNNSSLDLFDVPRAVDANNYIRHHKIQQLTNENYLGFNYRDNIKDAKSAMHAKYCIYCHKQEKDSCSKGFHHVNPDKHPKQEKDGCPLKQKISEMNFLKDMGLNIAALAAIIIDNPMVAATGHRICNDCMKTCIFQKQEPVNVPMIETNILEKTLQLPWGVEIYILLTQWNPLNIDDYLPKEKSNYNILIAGLGPAGFALSHYLTKEGHNVTAIDGLKISPLPFDSKSLIKDWNKIKIPLSEKKPQGFGGVAEYGITNRWDKNNLTLIRLILERRESFKMHGGIRLGSNITTSQGFEAGYDHIALCLGAGKPKYINKTDYFAKGVKPAADFLMNLQQGVPYMHRSRSNMQIRMPAIIIGCGLTAIDSAVEILHYYPKQVEKFYQQWQKINPNILSLSQEEKEIAEEYINHAKLLCTAKCDKERLEILQQLGGVTICYRKNIKKSPAYNLNHEEIEHAIANGVNFIENIEPIKLHLDQFGSAQKIDFSNNSSLRAKTILIAIGTNSNEFIDIDGLDDINSDIFKNSSKNISYFGDCNQKYAGSVVKALASAKNGYKKISESLDNIPAKTKIAPSLDFDSYVHKISNLAENITEIVIHSRMCASNYIPGQFFRLQNYSNQLSQTSEPLALTCINVDYDKNLLTFVIQHIGNSSKICATLKKGELVMLMGPTGTPTKIVRNANILLMGSDIGNALLLPTAKALKANNCNITLISSYKQNSDLIYENEIDSIADSIIRSFETNTENPGNIIDALNGAKSHNLLDNIDYIYCSVSDQTMKIISKEKDNFFPNTSITYSINAPMQCMMKGICGQCIQKTKDSYIFSCACQNIEASNIVFESLNNRLKQNSLSEKIT